MLDPLTQVQHQWVAISVTPVLVMRRPSGEVLAIADPNEEPGIQVGCALCNASPEEGWPTLCPGEEGGFPVGD